MKSVAVIGAGPSGLCAVKHCIEENFKVIAFEQNNNIGGEWYSTTSVGKNKYGIDAHSSIYENLVTNLPKELMAFPDFPYDEKISESFLTPDKVLNYFHSYSNTFQLRDHIKFEHHVMRVRPLPNTDTWEVIVKDLPNDEIKTFYFDYVFICTGISTPLIPKVEGLESFEGQVMHSHDYRSTKMFKSERILVIGSGPSALDIVLQVGEVAEKVFWVHKVKEKYGTDVKFELPTSVIVKPDIIKITQNGAEFMDESFESFSIIILATGFDFTFPFLSVDSGLSVDDKKVYPLYKHCLNINKPSLAIIGLPFLALAMPMFDLQVRFCLQFWTDKKVLPNKQEMLSQVDEDMKVRLLNSANNHKAHFFTSNQRSQYYEELAKVADIAPLKPVLGKIFEHIFGGIFDNFNGFKNYEYKLINDEEFECKIIE